MHPALLLVPLASGEHVLVEVAPGLIAETTEFANVAPGQPAGEMSQAFDAALSIVMSVLRTVGDQLDVMKPQEATVEVGFNLGNSGPIIAAKAADANLKLTVKWLTPDPETSRAP
jgi:hypothetical protein